METRSLHEVPKHILDFCTQYAPQGSAKYWISHYQLNGRLPRDARDLFFSLGFQEIREALSQTPNRLEENHG